MHVTQAGLACFHKDLNMKKIIFFASLVVMACEPRSPITNGGQFPDSTPILAPVATTTPIILFAEDSAELTQTAQSQLVATATALKNTTQNIRIIGHADEEGSREYNLGLGAQRAAAVRNILVANGIASIRISISTVGNENPTQNCDSSSCKAQNRRVVIIAG